MGSVLKSQRPRDLACSRLLRRFGFHSHHPNTVASFASSRLCARKRLHRILPHTKTPRTPSNILTAAERWLSHQRPHLAVQRFHGRFEPAGGDSSRAGVSDGVLRGGLRLLRLEAEHRAESGLPVRSPRTNCASRRKAPQRTRWVMFGNSCLHSIGYRHRYRSRLGVRSIPIPIRTRPRVGSAGFGALARAATPAILRGCSESSG